MLISNKKSFLFFLGLFVCSLPFSVEAKSISIDKIFDPKAKEAYIQQIKETSELIEQGQKMQRQIEQLQQSLEHFNFQDLDKTYNSLNGTITALDDIFTTASGMNTTISEMDQNWSELHTDYNSKDMTAKRKKELEEKRKQRKEDSEKRTLKMLSIMGDPVRLKEDFALVKKDLTRLEQPGVKASPIKAIQGTNQLLVHLLRDNKMIQMMAVNKEREEIQKKQAEEDEKKQKKAEAKREAEQAGEQVETFAVDKKGVVFDGVVASSIDEFESAVSSDRSKERSN